MKGLRLIFVATALITACFASTVGAVIELRGEFLYLRPSFCNDSYVIADTLPYNSADPDAPLFAPNGEVQRVAPGYEPGFRLSVGWLDCDSLYNMTLTYTYLHHRHRNETTPPVPDGALWPTFGRPENLNFPLNTFNPGPPFGLTQALATSKERFDYDAVEFQVGHRSHHNENFCLRTWGALHFAHLERLRDAFYQGAVILDEAFPARTATVHSSSRVWGLGPKVGVDLRLALLCGFGVGGTFSAGIVGGERHRHFREIDNLFFDSKGQLDSQPFETDLCFRDALAVFTVLNARLGINYGLRCGRWTILFALGYEYLDYLNSLEVINFTGPTSTFNLFCEDIRMDGIYAAVRVEF